MFFSLTLVLWAQRVKDFVMVEGARSNPLMGIGLVMGLNGNGDSIEGEAGKRLMAFIRNHEGWGLTREDIISKNVALVTVLAELPPFQAEGTKIDVRVQAIGDAKSLSGGTLLITPLRGPTGVGTDPTVYALAFGPLIIEGDPRTGNQTAATIPNGAIVERALQHNFVQVTKQGHFVTLHLKKTDFSLANTIANAINNAGLFGFTIDQAVDFGLAKAIDGGTIRLKIPTIQDLRRYGIRIVTDYVNQPVQFVSQVLDARVQLAEEEQALVIINDKTKVISVTGRVIIRKGMAKKGNNVFEVQQDSLLQDVLKDPGIVGIPPQDLIDLIKTFDQMGLIQGTVISN
jgi:flagellar P-ring protein precursor FlgI